jgi:hypothetical protein
MHNTLVIAYYSNSGYHNMTHRMGEIMKAWDIPFREYSREWLVQQPLYEFHRDVLDSSKGGGYWSWKPIIMLDALKEYENIIYLDSSVVPNSLPELERLITEANPITVHYYPEIQRCWCKRSCFRIMGLDAAPIWDASHLWAGVIGATYKAIDFIRQWQFYCLNYDCVSDSPCQDNFECFREHRHDQAILANLMALKEYPLFNSKEFADINNFSGKYG